MSKKFSSKKRHIVFSKTKGKCVMCGIALRLEPYDDSNIGDSYNRDGRYMQIDHFVPRLKGGTNDISNLFPICRSCNAIKGSQTIDSIYARIDEIEKQAKEEIGKKHKLIKLLMAYDEVRHEI